MTLQSAPSAHSSRIAVKPARSTRGLVDGAWWPHTRDLERELATIAPVLNAKLTRLERVGYHVNDWDQIDARKVNIGGFRVSLDGFTYWAPKTVRFVGPSTSLTLAVLPPDIDAGTARAIMARASHTSNTQSAGALLTTAATPAESNWETEGGAAAAL